MAIAEIAHITNKTIGNIKFRESPVDTALIKLFKIKSIITISF